MLMALFIVSGFLACSNSDASDPSLTTDEYEVLGIPSYQKQWTGADYNAACNKLFKIKYQSPRALPAKDSKKSGRLFDRLVSLENLSFLNNDTLPLYKKAYLISTFINIQSTLLDIYFDASSNQQYYSSELVQIYIFGLRVTEEMVALAREINESSDRKDKYMQYEYKTIQISYLKMIEYVLDRLKYISLYTFDDFNTLSTAVTTSIESNLALFDSVAVNHIRPGLQAVIDSSSSRDIKAEYSVLIDSLDLRKDRQVVPIEME